PGFREARIKAVAPLMGVRETRRIVGDYTLRVDDLVGTVTFPDTIALSAYGWDLPDPNRPSHQPMHGQSKSPVTPIPYRIMVPRPVENLICPGRAVSVERDVLGPIRVMAPCMAMGEAAGLAACQAVRRGVSFREVETQRLRAALRECGAIVNMTHRNGANQGIQPTS
ncbi:MAG: FAD-dependent oxidoreductase, partial [Candidatus Latescibacteria bacterium]|nr:FAD-dependent oxidoreductase [Candidatus Latescibacterota bacterium]